jgi:cellulose synthase/poly-beta-1,6-N-acetylglucosamine synthase-like glycosyltransferase
MEPSCLKYYFKASVFINALLIIIFIYILILSFKKKKSIKYLQFQYREYINDCNNLKSYKRNTQINEINPYVSIGIPAYNMEKYIEKSLLGFLY